jgi:amino acid adenylation domain-containing protein
MTNQHKATSVVDLVERACQQFGKNSVATGAGETLTYSELWLRSVQLANDLIAKGVKPETRVGLWAERSSDLLVGIVGILAAGGAYVPLDPSYPEDRLNFMVTHAGLSHIVAADRDHAAASALGIPVVSTTSSRADESRDPLPMIHGHDAAYVIYTSGSTGNPKGVVVEHRSLLDLCEWISKNYDLASGDVVISTWSPAFDASILTIFLSILSGATYIFTPEQTTKNPYALVEMLAHYRPRILDTSGTMLRMLTEISWPGDKELEIWTGGELIARSVIEFIVPRVRRLRNHYGPTEATVFVTVRSLSAEDTDSPIGRERDNVKCLLLDEDGRPTPIGMVGELMITGSSLARGYLNDPALTEERFIEIATNDGPVIRAYRTGDLAKVRGDGSFVFLGRNDDQVKLRGYRIELREIELRIKDYPGITEAIVVVHQLEGDIEPQLIAFFTASAPVDQRTLRDYSRETLPDFMVPTSFVQLEEFPLTPNGKVDKRSLTRWRDFSGQRITTSNELKNEGLPLSDTERAIRAMFADVLHMGEEDIGVNDDFLEIGGTSLGAVQLFIRIEEDFGIRLSVSTLITAATVRLLAVIVNNSRASNESTSNEADLPQNDWESALCQLWSEVLDIPEVLRTDNFFELGGTDAQARRMVAQLETDFGHRVTMSELTKAPVVTKLAALTWGRNQWKDVVPLNRTGTKPPFFCVTGSGGLAFAYLPLARLLGPDQPFYGLQAHGIDSRGLPDYTIKRAAVRHARAIRSVQPHGPYMLGGYSIGGVEALMVANELAVGGEEVALLALLDSYISRRMIGRKKPTVNKVGAQQKASFFPRIQTRFSVILRLPIAGLVPQKGLAQFELFRLLSYISGHFIRKVRPWAGTTVVYISEREDIASTRADWEELLLGSVSYVPLPVHHLDMLRAPHIELLAADLRDQINKVVVSDGLASSSNNRAAPSPSGIEDSKSAENL